MSISYSPLLSLGRLRLCDPKGGGPEWQKRWNCLSSPCCWRKMKDLFSEKYSYLDNISLILGNVFQRRRREVSLLLLGRISQKVHSKFLNLQISSFTSSRAKLHKSYIIKLHWCRNVEMWKCRKLFLWNSPLVLQESLVDADGSFVAVSKVCNCFVVQFFQ